MNDSRLLQLLYQKDPRAVRILFSRFHKPLQAFISRTVADRHLVEEITQDTFVEFFEAVRNFKGGSSLKTFLFSIARYKSIDVIRKKKIKHILFSALSPRVVEGLKTILIDDEIDRKDLQRKIEYVFARLPNDYAVILRLKYIDNEPVQNIAAIMALSFKAAESLLYRARKAFITIFKTV